MKRTLFTILLLGSAILSFGQGTCSFGTTSDNTTGAENVTLGGDDNWTGAADFDVPSGTSFTANKVTFNLTKSTEPLQHLNVTFRTEENGLPGEEIVSYSELIPTSEVFVYDIPEVNQICYTVTVDLPSAVSLANGKYFVQLSAVPAPGDDTPIGWEITNEEQVYGVFDYLKFGNDPWSGTGYYNKVFEVIGDCEDSGEEQPEYGEACQQENLPNGFYTAATFLMPGGIVSVADDIVVEPNTTFHLTKFTMHSLLLGAGLDNATINIRSEVGGAPGPVLHSYATKGPSTEDYNGYTPFPGMIFDVVSVLISFSFENEPIVLTEGNYFIEVIPTPHATDFLAWQGTWEPSIGFSSYSSFDQGNTWQIHDDLNLVFSVDGFCGSTLGTDTPEAAASIKYFPNPVRDLLQIESERKVDAVALYNMGGQEVRFDRVSEKNIDMQELASGVYLVKLQFGDGNFETFKVIKE